MLDRTFLLGEHYSENRQTWLRDYPTALEVHTLNMRWFFSTLKSVTLSYPYLPQETFNPLGCTVLPAIRLIYVVSIG